MSKDDHKLGFVSLASLIVGSMIGGGVFNLPGDMSRGSGTAGIIIGWLITGIGMISLAFVYQMLADKRSELKGGVYSYAKTGFGKFMGFNSAWGYWLSAWIGNVSYSVLLFGAIGYFFPVFGNGNNLASIIGASILLWFLTWLVLKGVKSAAIVNVVATIAKLVPILLFVVISIFAFNFNKFNFEFWGTPSLGGIFNQVKSTMLVTLWCFIGIEGAVVVSGRAKNQRDVGKATVVGLVCTLLVYILVTLMSLGIMHRGDLANLENPSLAYVLEQVIGKPGAIIINLGLIISLFGSLLGWTLLAAEIPEVAANDNAFPKVFCKLNKVGSPTGSLIITNILVQIFLIITLFSNSTYQALYSVASTAILIPYMFSAFYAFKICFVEKDTKIETKFKISSLISSVYAIWLIYAAGIKYLFLCFILYAIGIFFYIKARKENNESIIFTSSEKYWAIAILGLGVLAVITLLTGFIKL